MTEPTIYIHEVTDEEFIEDIRRLEAKFGMTSDEFYAKWQTPEGNDAMDFSPDGFEYNCWAALHRHGKALGLI